MRIREVLETVVTLRISRIYRVVVGCGDRRFIPSYRVHEIHDPDRRFGQAQFQRHQCVAQLRNGNIEFIAQLLRKQHGVVFCDLACAPQFEFRIGEVAQLILECRGAVGGSVQQGVDPLRPRELVAELDHARVARQCANLCETVAQLFEQRRHGPYIAVLVEHLHAGGREPLDYSGIRQIAEQRLRHRRGLVARRRTHGEERKHFQRLFVTLPRRCRSTREAGDKLRDLVEGDVAGFERRVGFGLEIVDRAVRESEVGLRERQPLHPCVRIGAQQSRELHTLPHHRCSRSARQSRDGLHVVKCRVRFREVEAAGVGRRYDLLAQLLQLGAGLAQIQVRKVAEFVVEARRLIRGLSQQYRRAGDSCSGDNRGVA